MPDALPATEAAKHAKDYLEGRGGFDKDTAIRLCQAVVAANADPDPTVLAKAFLAGRASLSNSGLTKLCRALVKASATQLAA